MNKFWDLLRESVILQAILTTGIWGSVIYLTLVGRPVPQELVGAANLVLGFYFGSKVAMAKGAITYIQERRKDE